MKMKRTDQLNTSLLLRGYEYIRPKIGPRAYARLVWTEVCKHPAVWTAIALFTLSGVIFAQFYSIAFNLTPSVPYKILLVDKSQPLPGTLKRNELVAWYWQGGMHYGEGALFVKFVKGLPGDRVETRGADGRDYYINGEYLGRYQPDLIQCRRSSGHRDQLGCLLTKSGRVACGKRRR